MIDSFSGKYRFLSNFFPAKVVYEGVEYPSSEHAYQAAKTLDIPTRLHIAAMETPGETKRAGKKLAIRSDWDQVKISVMEEIVRDKFTRNLTLRQKLIDTGDQILIEGNTWFDTFWGVCNGKGQNHLGKILMKVRKELGGQ